MVLELDCRKETPMAKENKINIKPVIRHDKTGMSSTKRQALTPGRSTRRQRPAGLQGGRDMGPPR